MNRGCHRALFNEALGTWIAVSETTRARGKRCSTGAVLAAALASTLLAAPTARAQSAAAANTQLLPRAGAALPSNVKISAPAAGRTLIEQTGRTAVIQWDRFNLAKGDALQFLQKDAAGAPDPRAATLNRIWDANPSLINGRIQANGTVYLVNRNGIRFGPDAVVDVGGLVASALNIQDSVFEAGYLSLSGTGRPAFSFDDQSYSLVAALPEPQADGKPATVRNEGRLTAADGGSVLLFAPRVENSGRIETRSGQVVLAAGQKVYLSSSTDAGLRGVLVEVDPFPAGDRGGSTVRNDTPQGVLRGGATDIEALKAQMQGIFAQRGNITLAAMAVNNNGRLEASTGKTENGSIYLQARGGAQFVPATDNTAARVVARQGGELELGASSLLLTPVEAPGEAQIQAQVQASFVPPAAGESAAITAARLAQTDSLVRKQYSLAADESLRASVVNLDGGSVLVRDGALLRSPGGVVSLKAEATRFAGTELTPLNKTAAQRSLGERIVIEPGARIDVSGLTGAGESAALSRGADSEFLYQFSPVAVDGASNQISAVLVSNELKDAPLQRDGILFKKTVQFSLLDAPSGKLAVADVSGTVAARTRTLAQASTAGGRLSLTAEDALVLGQGAVLDVSGGSTAYSAARLKTSVLVAGTTAQDITSASAERRYDRIETVERDVAAYTQGGDGGALTINARQARLDGELRGHTQAGRHQRVVSSQPRAARLVVGDAEGGLTQETQNFGNGVTFNPLPLAIGAGHAVDSAFWADPLAAPVFGPAEAARTLLSPSALGTPAGGGFGDVRLYAGGELAVEQDVVTAAGALLWLTASNGVRFGGDAAPPVTLRGAGLRLSAQSGQVQVGDGSRIDASGLWVNDFLAARTAGTGASGGFDGLLQLDGGSIQLGGTVALGAGSVLDVSGGARLAVNGSASAGKAGSLTLVGLNSVPDPGGLRGFAFAASATRGGAGGSFDLRTASGLQLGGSTTVAADTLRFDADFFTLGGFSSRSLATTNANVEVAAGAAIAPARQLRDARAGQALPTGSAWNDALPTLSLPASVGDAQSLSLSADAVRLSPNGGNPDGGRLVVGEGARVDVGTAGVLSLAAKRLLAVQGQLLAPAGTLNLRLAGSVQPVGDEGYFVDQSIYLPPEAVLDVSGRSLVAIDARGQRGGVVLDGGTVNLLADKGYVIVNRATVNLDGASDSVDVATTGQRIALNSNAGALNLSSREGIVLDAALSGRTGSSHAAGARLSLTLAVPSGSRGQEPTPGLPPEPGGLYPTGERIVHVGAGVLPDLSASTPAAPEVAALRDGRNAFVSPAALVGFSSIAISAQDAIRFEGQTALAAGRSVTLDAPRVELAPQARATVSAPFVELRQSDITTPAATAVATGDGRFSVHASQQIDITGHTALSGTASSQLTSDGALRLNGVLLAPGGLLDARASGSLLAAGDLTLSAAQVHASSATDFSLRLPDEGATLRVQRQTAAADPAAPLSAGSHLSLEAGKLVQAGVLRAPFGEIDLVARSQLVLAQGSLTSASGEGQQVPYGELQNGASWLRTTGNGQELLTASPKPRVALRAPDVEQAAGSRVDLSGRGDLYAYEFVAGPGGSTDVLAAPGSYAVLPTEALASAPRDLQLAVGFNKAVGSQVTLAAGGGLAAGTYTLLPARYALLPGAFLVTPVAGFTDLAADSSKSLLSGAALVSGREGVAGTTLQAQRSGAWRVESSSVLRQRALYSEALGNAFFSQAAEAAGRPLGQRPVDAGQLVVQAEARWQAAGQVDMSPGQWSGLQADGSRRSVTGLGGALDLSAGVLSVGGGDTGLVVDTAQLAAVGAASVLLGGERRFDPATGAATLRVDATEVNVAPAAALVAGELLLAATDAVQLGAGARLSATSRPSAQAGAAALTVKGDGALLRVASDGREVQRSEAKALRGRLSAEAGVELAGAAVQLDATLDTRLDASTHVQASALSLSAARFTFGADPSTSGAGTGLALADTLLDSLALSAGRLTLRSYQGFDFATDTRLGSEAAPLAALTLDGPRLAWTGAEVPGQVAIHAKSLTLQNTVGPGPVTLPAAAAAAATPGAHLMLQAQGDGSGAVPSGRLTLGDGAIALQGFSDSTLSASQAIVFDGQGSLNQEGDATLRSALITGTANTRHALLATGALRTEALAGSQAAVGAAAQINLQGRTLQHATRLAADGGNLKLSATGGDLTLAAGGSVEAAGRETRIGSQTVASAAGTVTLASATGQVQLQDKALLDVSGRGDADAGRLVVSAPGGEFQIQGTLRAGITSAARSAGAAGGELALDLQHLASLDDLNARTADFSGERSVRLRQGDLVFGQGQQLQARRIVLAADLGDVSVAGTLDASGPQGGRIELAARRALDGDGQERGGHVTLQDGARLLAQATAAGGRGGEVLISVGADQVARESGTGIVLNAGSLIDVSGGPASGSTAAGRGGSLTLRSPRLNNEADWNVQAARLELIGAPTALVGAVDLSDARVYPAREPARVSPRASFAPTPSLIGTGGARTLQLTLPSTTDLAAGFFFTWNSGNITGAGGPTLRVTLDDGTVVGGTTGVNAQVFRAVNDAQVANPASATLLSWSTNSAGLRNGATYFVQRRANRWVIDTRVTPVGGVGGTPVEFIRLDDAAFNASTGERIFFELDNAPATGNPQLLIGGRRFGLLDKDGQPFTAESMATDLKPGVRLAAEFVPNGGTVTAGSLRLLNRPGDARPVGLTVAGLSAATDLRAIRFAAGEDVAGGPVALYINGLAPQPLRSSDDSSDGRISGSGVNTVAFQAGRYLQYAGTQERVLTAGEGQAFADAGLLVFRTGGEAAASTQPIQVKLGGSTLALRGVDGQALDSLVPGQAYWAVREGNSALRLVDKADIQSRLALDNAGATVRGAQVVQLEGVKTVEAGVVDAALQDTLRGASRLFDSQRDAIVARSFAAGAPDGTALRVTPGFEIRSAGDLTVADSWDLGSRSNGAFDWRFGNGGEAAGALTLRAAGTLRLQGSVVDGAVLAEASARAPTDQSWTLRLVGGADLAAASLGGLRADAVGDIVLGNNTRVQTGTADVSLVAAGSIRFSAGSSVLTTGARFEDKLFKDFAAPNLQLNQTDASAPTAPGAGGGFYTHNGGTLSFSAGGDLVGLGDRPLSEWLWAQGSYQADGLGYQNQPAWWVRPDRFAHAAGTLGGGDITVRAVGDIRGFSAMLPTQGVVSGAGPADGVAHVIGGGDLDLRAGGNLVDGQFLVDQGVGRLSANGAVTGTRAKAPGPRLYLGEAQVSVAGAGEVTLAQIGSATVQPQSSLVSNVRAQSAFYRYGADTRVQLQSAAGDVHLAATNALADGSRADVLPPVLDVAALAGNIVLPDLDLAPSATGQLRLLAQGNIQLGGDQGVRLRDADPAGLPSPVRPAWGNPSVGPYLQPQRNWEAFATPFGAATGDAGVRVETPGYSGTLHAGDTQAVRVVSARGDIGGTLVSAKPVDLAAGRDVSGLLLLAQNLDGADTTRVQAGRDIVFPEQRDATSQALIANDKAIRVYGPGRVAVSAGRHVSLGASSGITTDGPGNNPALPERGASLQVVAGAAAAVDNPALVQRFIATYLKGTPGQPDYRAAWTAFAAAQGQPADPAQADAGLFQRFRTQVLWSELAIAGTEGNALKQDAEAHPGKYTPAELEYRRVYGRGYTAIALAGLDVSPAAAGDLRMAFSQIKTRAGGDLELLVPAGSLEVGGTRPLGSKPASQLGLVATEGDARVLVQGSVAVNTSRWFAIDGGDILGWASLGNIDAGKGARTAVSSSSQRLDVDIQTGRFKLVDAGGASGSGIATLFNRPVLGGDVKLFAPNGIIDAGEAGIRAAGSLELTLNVANADFIVAVGASNAPAAPATPSLAGLSLGSPSAAAATTTVAAAPAGASDRPRNALLTVEVVAGAEAGALIAADPPAAGPTGTAGAEEKRREARKRCLAAAKTDADRSACGPE